MPKEIQYVNQKCKIQRDRAPISYSTNPNGFPISNQHPNCDPPIDRAQENLCFYADPSQPHWLIEPYTPWIKNAQISHPNRGREDPKLSDEKQIKGNIHASHWIHWNERGTETVTAVADQEKFDQVIVVDPSPCRWSSHRNRDEHPRSEGKYRRIKGWLRIPPSHSPKVQPPEANDRGKQVAIKREQLIRFLN